MNLTDNQKLNIYMESSMSILDIYTKIKQMNIDDCPDSNEIEKVLMNVANYFCTKADIISKEIEQTGFYNDVNNITKELKENIDE